MSIETWFLGLLLFVVLPAIAVSGALFVRRMVGVDVLARHNDVAGFIYGVIGVVYAVLLGFTAIIVWEQFRNAQRGVEREANALADLYRAAQVFPPDVRDQVDLRVRAYTKLVTEKEWPAMALGGSSPETWDEYDRLWRTYHGFQPQNEHQHAWYTQSIRRLIELGDARRDRLLSVQSAVPKVIWTVLLCGGAVTIGFSFLFGAPNARVQGLMTAGLAFTIGVVLLSILALEEPFAGITRIDPRAFHQVEDIIESWSQGARSSTGVH